MEMIDRISELKSKGKSFCIITVVDSVGATPRKAGARAVVKADGSSEGTVGGGAIEVTAFKKALDIIKSGVPFLKEYQLDQLEEGSMVCGGSMTLYFEPVLPLRRLTIFGGGHVGQALSRVASEAGWQITIVDERNGIFDTNDFPDGARLVNESYLDYCKKQEFDENDWLVIVTPQHRDDESILGNVARVPAKYIGLMGSPKKIKEVMTNLKDKGIEAEYLNRVRAPIGLNIGTETPGEIAVSIVSEMLSVHHGIEQIKSCSE